MAPSSNVSLPARAGRSRLHPHSCSQKEHWKWAASRHFRRRSAAGMQPLFRPGIDDSCINQPPGQMPAHQRRDGCKGEAEDEGVMVSIEVMTNQWAVCRYSSSRDGLGVNAFVAKAAKPPCLGADLPPPSPSSSLPRPFHSRTAAEHHTRVSLALQVSILACGSHVKTL